MFARIIFTAFFLGLVFIVSQAEAQHPGGRAATSSTNAEDWNRFYHYPYVYYPQNFWSPEYFRSGNNMYNRYPAEMQVPAYNRTWQNFSPAPKKFHQGNHFRLDIF